MIQQDSTVTMTQVYNDFKGALQGAADALKVGAEHIYEVLVYQQLINSITLIIMYVAITIASYYTWRIVLKFVDKESKQDRYGEWGYMYIIPVLVTLISIIIFLGSIQNCITGFLNPEYNALMEIKSFIK